MPLTDVACRNASCPAGKARERFYDANGMYLEVMPTGSKYWRLKYRFAGKEKRLALGPYPAVGLAQARIAREKARSQLRDLVDPAEVRKQAKLALRPEAEVSFETVARAWHDHWRSSRSESHTQYVIRRLEADVFPVIGKLPIRQVTAPRLVAMAKLIEK